MPSCAFDELSAFGGGVDDYYYLDPEYVYQMVGNALRDYLKEMYSNADNTLKKVDAELKNIVDGNFNFAELENRQYDPKQVDYLFRSIYQQIAMVPNLLNANVLMFLMRLSAASNFLRTETSLSFFSYYLKYEFFAQEYLNAFIAKPQKSIGAAVYEFVTTVGYISPSYVRSLAKHYKKEVYDHIMTFDDSGKSDAFNKIFEEKRATLSQFFFQRRGLLAVSKSRGLMKQVYERYLELTNPSIVDGVPIEKTVSKPGEDQEQEQVIVGKVAPRETIGSRIRSVLGMGRSSPAFFSTKALSELQVPKGEVRDDSCNQLSKLQVPQGQVAGGFEPEVEEALNKLVPN